MQNDDLERYKEIYKNALKTHFNDDIHHVPWSKMEDYVKIMEFMEHKKKMKEEVKRKNEQLMKEILI